MEGSHYFYIVSLIVWFFLISVDCFGLQELFEVWSHIEFHKIENVLPVFIKLEDGYSHRTRDPIV